MNKIFWRVVWREIPGNMVLGKYLAKYVNRLGITERQKRQLMKRVEKYALFNGVIED